MKGLNCQTSLDAFQELVLKDEQILETVLERVEEGCRDLIVLKFTAGVLAFAVESDTDEIDVHYQEIETFDSTGLSRAANFAPWSSLVGRPFGWGWVTINQQGYRDGVLLSFGDIEPSVLLVVAASSLRVYSVNESAIRSVAANDKG